MAQNADRSSYFPAIEKKYGHKMSYWHLVMAELADLKYAEQVAYLKENHGFSQAHANALVMYSRGSKTSKRFNTLDEYLAPHDAVKAKTVRAIFKAIQTKNKGLEIVIAWNQPMLRNDAGYIFGVSVLKNHILLGPWGKDVIAAFEGRLTGLEANKKTIQVPIDWNPDAKLLNDLVAYRLRELS